MLPCILNLFWIFEVGKNKFCIFPWLWGKGLSDLNLVVAGDHVAAVKGRLTDSVLPLGVFAHPQAPSQLQLGSADSLPIIEILPGKKFQILEKSVNILFDSAGSMVELELIEALLWGSEFWLEPANVWSPLTVAPTEKKKILLINTTQL